MKKYKVQDEVNTLQTFSNYNDTLKFEPFSERFLNALKKIKPF